MTLLIAIDQSTSATKALLIDAGGAVIDTRSKDHRQHYPQPGWVEHDASEIWANTLAVCRELCEAHAGQLGDVRGVSISNQRETFVVFDRQTGEPLAPAIVWQCRRSDQLCEELRASGAGAEVVAKTGLKIDSYFSGPKIAWLMRRGGPVADAVAAGTACIGTIDAYLIHRLTQGRVFATDPTNASRTLLVDIARREWDDGLCELFGAPRQALPEVRDSDSEFGQTDLGGALPDRVPLRGVLGDSQASLFAQRCYAPGDAKATFGSGTSVLLNIGSEHRQAPTGAVTAVAWVVGGTPAYAWEGLINYSAATLAWLKDQLGLIASYDEIEPMASAVDDTGGVYLVPAFSGMGAPHWKPEARAALVGMSGYTRREHVVRAALESIAFQVNDVIESFAPDGGAPTTLRVDGGPTRNRLLMQIVADVTRCELIATDESNLSAVGAAMAGMLGLGMAESLEALGRLPRRTESYKPQASVGQTADLVAGWRSAVERVL